MFFSTIDTRPIIIRVTKATVQGFAGTVPILSCIFRVLTKACRHAKLFNHYEMSPVVSDYIANVVLL